MPRHLLVVLAFAVSSPASQALLINGYDADSHQRFNNDAMDFIGYSHDWSGVGIKAAMLSDRFFISANHSHPGVNSSLTFHHTNDMTGDSESHTVAAGTRIGSTDLWLGRLSAPVSSSVAKYPVLSISPTNVIGAEAWVFGVSHRLGRNVVDDFTNDMTGVTGAAGTGDAISYDYDTGMAGLGIDEAMVQGGDSGWPVFTLTPQGPAVLGVHWFRYIDDMDPTNRGSGDSFVSSYISEINAVMSPFEESLTIVAVPEPSTLFGIGMVLLLACVRRRRNVEQLFQLCPIDG